MMPKDGFNTKTEYRGLGEPDNRRVKAKVGDRVKIMWVSSYKLPVGLEGTVYEIMNRRKPGHGRVFSDWDYRIKWDNGRKRTIMASSMWEVVK